VSQPKRRGKGAEPDAVRAELEQLDFDRIELECIAAIVQRDEELWSRSRDNLTTARAAMARRQSSRSFPARPAS
jgi:hypothetical protein